ncbi:MAG: hypothetical protein CXT78_06705 [Thaumarchaeota archaeon]|jgi:hypothetical protein|nr:MAG: hypothetical protein CXT78_06705 [Nitrososphaerota archaeon]
MKDKILYWFGADFTHFCSSYYLQKSTDAELYAIIDITNKPKSFFENQTLVKFNKIWFFHDHIKKNTKPDLDYLADFEKKYNIDLLKLAINERMFYRFFDFHNFSTDEILSIVEQECRLFEKVIDEIKPDFLITKEASRHHHQLFCDLCNSIGIKVIMMSQAKIGYKCMLSKESHKFPFPESFNSLQTSNFTFEEIQKYLKSFNVSKQLKSYLDREGGSLKEFIKSVFEYLISDNSHSQTQYYYYGRTKISVLKSFIKSNLHRRQRKSFIDNNLLKKIPKRSSYVYFPMAVDMERNLLITAPYYTNQIETIRHIVKSLPVNYELYVKENPNAASRDWRSIDEYKEIMKIPNVKLIHPSANVEKIYQNSSLVIAIAGSSAFEAAAYGKPSIIFSDQIYDILPSIFKVKNLEDLPELIRKALQTKVISSDVGRYLNLLKKNTFDFDILGFSATFKDKFYHGGNLLDVSISEEKLKDFLMEQKDALEKFTLEHIKRINWYKENVQNKN